MCEFLSAERHSCYTPHVRSLLSFVIFAITLGVVGRVVWTRLPCAVPVPVMVGEIDPRFDVSPTQISSAMAKAKTLWEGATDRTLFEIVEQGGVPVNIVYDARQQNAEQLKVLDSAIKVTEGRRQEIKTEYDALRAEYDRKQAVFARDRATYEAAQKAFVAEVEAGPPATESEAISRRRRGEDLDEQFRTLMSAQVTLNDLAGKINVLVEEDRALVPAENSTIDAFNDLARANGDEYQTGLFTSGPQGRSIDLYVYENPTQLERLLAHEMGHAVGMGHVSDEQALMYRLNISKKSELTAADREALAQVCRYADPLEWPALLWEWIQLLRGGRSLAPA